MKYREQESQGDWAREVPQPRFRRPYEDYGWEPRESVLPEFRDPSIHLTSEEQKRVAAWRRSQEIGWQRRSGPYSGRGPHNYVRSDERIYEDVCVMMTAHGQLDASNIMVEVHNGEVTLTGDVPDRRTKRLAEDISDSIPGVQDVHNRLQIGKQNSTPARWVDRVAGSGVYPASEAEQAPQDSETQGMSSWGQGERGAEGYNDSGESEIHPG